MVDLVKIRKKAKKTLTPSESEGAGREGGAQPVVEQHEEAGRGSGPGPGEDAARSTQHPAPESATPEDAGHRTQDAGPSSSSKLDRFKEQAGRKREGLIQAEEIADSGEQFELLTFVIAGEHYALDIEHIVEIVTPRDTTRVPNADPSIVGIISLRGTIVTLIDVRARLRHQGVGLSDADTRVVVVQFRDETVGFQVDRVLRVIKVDRTAIEPHPVVHVSEQSEAIRGVFHHANALTILLDFDKLLGARHGTHL
jgi:purine-binding chemotaxis protein CheW